MDEKLTEEVAAIRLVLVEVSGASRDDCLDFGHVISTRQDHESCLEAALPLVWVLLDLLLQSLKHGWEVSTLVGNNH